ncbi:TonB-dependent siderophore receptor [Acinetobacter larvae]|uniref:TonB-dependent receptor n=1 Tax=Acinetobacter larvae TaxID=1789224 RepID=A0A1B2M0J2_9GAMM|nr:TonB-dependent receptor [Acinetobacter larvae]AOA58543.1 TonB-dependent receptor [Acinetobacter larvae]
MAFYHKRHKKITLKPIVISLQMVLCAGLYTTQSAVFAAQHMQRSHYKIAAANLNQVLNLFAAQSGIAIAMDGAQLAHYKSAGLHGSYSVPEGFNTLLANTAFQAQQTAQGYIIVKKAQQPNTSAQAVTQLPPEAAAVDAETTVAELAVIELQAQQDTTKTEGRNSYTTGQMNTATKLKLSMRETPQSVSVLTRQQIDDLALTTLDDAAQNVTGLVMQKGYYTGDSGSISARGFPLSNILIDGVPMTLGANGTFNGDNDALDIYDRVEVVRGATGLTTGVGTPSASINLVRKRPTTQAQGAATISLGSWQNYKTSLDYAGPLNRSGALRARTVVSAQDRNEFYDQADAKNYQFYGIVEADLSPQLLATLGVHYRKVDNHGGSQNLPNISNGELLQFTPTSNLSNAFDYWKQEDLSVFSELLYKINEDWNLKFSSLWKRPQQDLLFTSLQAASTQQPWRQHSQAYQLDNTADSYDLAVDGHYQLLQRKHDIMFGLSHREKHNKNWGGWADYAWTNQAPAIDLSHWDAWQVTRPEIDMDLWNIDNKTNQQGIYAATRLNLADPLKIILGSRWSWYSSKNLRNNSRYEQKAEFTPYLGIIYDLNPQHSVYASWTEIFEPQSAVDRYGEQLQPITGVNYEIGLKGEYFDGQLNASIAGFLVQQQNRSISDLEGPNPCPGNTQGYCSRASGEVESKGFELELNGALTEYWQLSAGYTYVNTEYSKDSNAENVGKIFNPSLPKQQFKLSTQYQLPAQFNQWRVGGSIYAQNATSSSDDPHIRQAGYALVSLYSNYAVNKDLNLQFNLNNLLNKNYYTSLGWNSGGTAFGATRNFMITAKYKF